jgi:hypothetical protein
MSDAYAHLNRFELAAGEPFETDFIGECEVRVRREGHNHARHMFVAAGRNIGRLQWRGFRRAVYQVEDGPRYYISVGPLEKRVSVVSDDGGESFLVERSRANPKREELRAEMAEGDNFCVTRSCSSRLRSEVSLTVHKEHYKSTLMVFRFEAVRRTQTTVRVQITSTMRRESRFVHRLLALIVCRIILERRRSGAQPVRVKEQPGRVTGARTRDRRRPI